MFVIIIPAIAEIWMVLYLLVVRVRSSRTGEGAPIAGAVLATV